MAIIRGAARHRPDADSPAGNAIREPSGGVVAQPSGGTSRENIGAGAAARRMICAFLAGSR